MNRRFYLVLSIAILIGIQPVFAQQDEFAEEDIVLTEKTIDVELASDSEFDEALKTSSDIELINKNDIQTSEEKPSLPEKSAAEEPALAEEDAVDTEPAIAEKTTEDTGQEIPGGIRDNEYLRESLRLTKLAEDAYNYGDYDASASFAEAAIRSAKLSDEYVAQQMGPDTKDGTSPLPASYTIRSWGVSLDCFWNIAGRPWVYGNPHLWRVLYNANKAKLPDPNNPNLIEPGIVLDIPSLKGEVRQGTWDENKTYKPLQ
jgi:nucleoid-associated protein YgaU